MCVCSFFTLAAKTMHMHQAFCRPCGNDAHVSPRPANRSTMLSKSEAAGIVSPGKLVIRTHDALNKMALFSLPSENVSEKKFVRKKNKKNTKASQRRESSTIKSVSAVWRARILVTCLLPSPETPTGPLGGGNVVPAFGKRATNERDLPRFQNAHSRGAGGRQKAS